MRLRALLGGWLILATVSLHHRSSIFASATGAANQYACPAAGGAELCAAVTGLSAALRNPILGINNDILPPAETPGVVDPSISQATIDNTICRPGYARAVRPPYAVTAPLKRRLMALQHPGEHMADYELDHLIPISIGGAPLDSRDLWLQPRRGRANAADKNVLAYILWRLVCEHRVLLKTAQRAISHDWTQAYATYATAENVARYRYQPHEFERDYEDGT